VFARFATTVATLAFLAVSPVSGAPSINQCKLSTLKLEAPDNSDDRAELSGIVSRPGLLIAISNEALDGVHKVQVFEGSPTAGYRLARDERLAEPDGCEEADFEALAQDGEILYAIGSHSFDRKKQDKSISHKKNRRRLSDDNIKMCEARNKLLKFRLTGGQSVEAIQEGSLRPLVEKDPILGPFSHIPNKENGVDIEGMTFFAGSLLVGFRGPVLRENYVPVMRLSPDLTQIPANKADIIFLNLGGRGIRDLAPGPEEADGLYVLAGPNGDEGQNFAIYHWDGKDQVGGDGEEPDLRKPICLIDLDAQDQQQKSKPEGIAYLDTQGDQRRFVLLYDGDAPLRAKILSVKNTD
jgi:hypothetical protein